MSDLMRIGEFARFCDTTVDTLLHYDRMGLLRPAEVRENGYRYYAPEQVNRLISLKALTAAGFSLDETARLLDSRDLDAVAQATFVGEREIRNKIAELRDSLAQLTEINEQIKRVQALRFGEIDVIDIPDIPYLDVGIGWSGTVDEYAADKGAIEADFRALSRLMEASPAAGLAPYGLVSRGPIGDGPITYDGMLYLVYDAKAARKLKPSTFIPAGTYARIAFEGPWDDLSPAHRALVAYVREHGGDTLATRYEISTFRLFDSSSEHGFDSYSCTVLMKL